MNSTWASMVIQMRFAQNQAITFKLFWLQSTLIYDFFPETIKKKKLHETKQYSYSSRKKFYYCGKRCNEAFELFQLMSNLSGFCHDWLHLRVLAMICKNVQRLWWVSYTHFVFSFPVLVQSQFSWTTHLFIISWSFHNPFTNILIPCTVVGGKAA